VHAQIPPRVRELLVVEPVTIVEAIRLSVRRRGETANLMATTELASRRAPTLDSKRSNRSRR